MASRVPSRLILLLAGLTLAAVLILGAMVALASITPAEVAPLLERDQVADVQREIEAPAGTGEAADDSPAPDDSPTPVVLVFAGIVLLAALPPAHRVHVYHNSYRRPDWF